MGEAPKHEWRWDNERRHSFCKFCDVLLLSRTRDADCPAAMLKMQRDTLQHKDAPNG